MNNYSRYDFMTEGVTYDELSESYYPDPLSLNYVNLQITETPTKDVMNDPKIMYFWKNTENHYGSPIYDDIVLTLNGVSHKNFLTSGDTIIYPSLNDIDKSFNKSDSE